MATLPFHPSGAPVLSRHLPYRPDIDGLRAIAVLSVVAFHAFPERLPGGYVGVDIFFVISGFLISTIIFKGLSDGSFSFSQFYGRRIRRIFTALVLVLAACYAIGWVLLLPHEFSQLGKHIAGGAGFVSNFVLWAESDYFDAAAESRPLLHLWSLGIEEQFYILWPVLLVLVWKKPAGVIALGSVLLSCSFVLNLMLVQGDPTGAFYSPATRLWELVLGSALAYGVLRGTLPVRGAHLRSVAGLLLIALALILVNTERAFPGWWALLPTIGATMLISSGPDAWVNRNLLSTRVMVWIGLISFPLYLWHWPLLSFARIAGESAQPSREIRVALVLLSVLLAALTYVFVEQPVRTGRRARGKVVALAILTTVIGALGYHAYERNGFPSRFPPFVQEIGRFTFDYRAAYRSGSCFISTRQDATAFKECLGHGEVFLWGDSHAAHLYPGLQALLPGVAQFTKAGCPPILGAPLADRPHCAAVNAYVLGLIEKHQPARVILAAAWNGHDWKLVAATLAALNGAGVTRIDLVGPVPEWRAGLPRILVTHVRRGATSDLPERIRGGWDRTTLALDRDMEIFAAQNGATYHSAMKVLCNDAGCLARVSDDVSSLTAWDSSHFTSVASEYVVSRFGS